MTHAFKVGDTVVVRNVPHHERSQSPLFTSKMASLIGKRVKVSGVGVMDISCESEEVDQRLLFRPEWLEPDPQLVQERLGSMLERCLATIHQWNESQRIPYLPDLPVDVCDWWAERQKLIEERKHKLREQALAKLTSEERKALGV